jgi:hypothetical protein
METITNLCITLPQRFAARREPGTYTLPLPAQAARARDIEARYKRSFLGGLDMLNPLAHAQHDLCLFHLIKSCSLIRFTSSD